MALEGNIEDAAKALALGLATGFGAIGPGAGVGYLMGKTVESSPGSRSSAATSWGSCSSVSP
jgi:ATP synthase subunit C.